MQYKFIKRDKTLSLSVCPIAIVETKPGEEVRLLTIDVGLKVTNPKLTDSSDYVEVYMCDEISVIDRKHVFDDI